MSPHRQKQAPASDEELAVQLGGEPPELLRTAAKILERAGAYSVLCPACGPGQTGAYLARRGFRVTAYDTSRQRITQATSLARRVGVKVDCFVDDVVAPRRSFRSFDALYAGDILSHLLASQRRTLLRSCHRALRQGGLLIVSVMSFEDERFGYGRPVEPDTFEYAGGETVHFYSAPDLHAELSRFFLVTHIQDVVEAQDIPGVGRQSYRLLMAAAQKVDPG